ncbi:ABC transporter permease [Emticicia sp. TH156]|uniref:ABC transporter permease n=1 Tax=Emticicia sp. TH156 TaxID=2067454 RepID=UPI000C7880D7|nr:ABC transporter permease [Emticicia sp. TH156]PLK43869.1 phosphate ABC transporter permease [Emticicia sp. TH156]
MKKSDNEIVIKAGKSALHYWKDIWLQRELFWILGKRDIMVRYKQTVLGIAWAVFRPLLTAVVMTFAFGKIARMETDATLPYMIIVIPGVIIWLFFSQCLSQISNSIVGNGNLVSKVYFPRIIIPFSSLLVGLLDALIAFAMFFVFCLYYQFMPNWQVLMAPFFMLLAYLNAFGLGLVAAVLNVKYRDIAQIIPFIVQFGFFISPVGYTSEQQKTAWWYTYYNLNPIVGTIDGMRWSLLANHSPLNWQSLLPSIIFAIVSVIFSIWFFRKNENSFVDYI